MHTVANQSTNPSPFPRDLRGGDPAGAGAGKLYPVDPAAVERLKTQLAAKQAAPMAETQTAVPAVRRAEPKVAQPESADPTMLYPSAVIEAAKEQEASGGRRNMAAVLTDDVLAIWDRWNQDGRSCVWIGKRSNNGLIEVANNEVGRYLRKYRERLAAEAEPVQATAVPDTAASVRAQTPPPSVQPVATKVDTEPETAVTEIATSQSGIVDDIHSSTNETAADSTAVSEPDPEPTPETPTAAEPFVPQKPDNLPAFFDREYQPARPRPGDALGALVQLLNDERITVKGSVKLNVEIEFGG